MTAKELKKQAQDIQETAKKTTSSKKSAQKFLTSTNIYTSTGKLKCEFR